MRTERRGRKIYDGGLLFFEWEDPPYLDWRMPGCSTVRTSSLSLEQHQALLVRAEAQGIAYNNHRAYFQALVECATIREVRRT